MKIPRLLLILFFPLAAMVKPPDIILMMSDGQVWEESTSIPVKWKRPDLFSLAAGPTA